jgi:hypothetical protein
MIFDQGASRLGIDRPCLGPGDDNPAILQNGDLLVGAGDGTIAKIDTVSMLIKSQSKVMGAVTSITLTADSTHFFAGTSKSTLYWCNTDQINP